MSGTDRLISSLPMAQRVVITGLGVVSCCGIGKQAFWQAVRDGVSGISHVRSFDVSHLPCRIAGEVQGFDPEEYIEQKKARKQGRFVHFALAAARQAVEDAGIDLGTLNPYEVGVAFGSASAGFGNIADDSYRRVFEEGVAAVDRNALNEIPAHAATSHISMEFRLKGPSMSNTTGCVSSLVAVADAVEAIRRGEATCMVAAASEACLSPWVFEALCRQRVLSTRNDSPREACRPFDLERDGLVLGEGGGAVVLERADHALDRGARIYAEVLGAGFTAEAFHMVLSLPTGEELARALTSALVASRLRPEDIDYVCAHGIGSKHYDLADTRGLKLVLKEHAYRIPVSSIKAVTSQPFAAGGAFQIAAVCMAFEEQVVPPTINYHTPDPECDLDYVPNVARRARLDVAALNAHSFGGTHAALVLRRFVDGQS